MIDLSAVTMIEACAGVLPFVAKHDVNPALEGALLTPATLRAANRAAAASYSIGSPDSFEPVWLPALAVKHAAGLRLDRAPKRGGSREWLSTFRVMIGLSPGNLGVHLVQRLEHAEVMLSSATFRTGQGMQVAFPGLEHLFAPAERDLGRPRLPPYPLEQLAVWARRYRDPKLTGGERPMLTLWHGPAAVLLSVDRLSVAVPHGVAS
jgi:hypothetical protein